MAEQPFNQHMQITPCIESQRYRKKTLNRWDAAPRMAQLVTDQEDIACSAALQGNRKK
ncbi:MAG: hypothetical protein IJ523_12205 [Succinivibrionaceae bacterium]|nr:hypothetical protein [Succinivibrionaceae bacterium]